MQTIMAVTVVAMMAMLEWLVAAAMKAIDNGFIDFVLAVKDSRELRSFVPKPGLTSTLPNIQVNSLLPGSSTFWHSTEGKHICCFSTTYRRGYSNPSQSVGPNMQTHVVCTTGVRSLDIHSVMPYRSRCRLRSPESVIMFEKRSFLLPLHIGTLFMISLMR